MIELIPDQVDNALLYFHSAGQSSAELEPFLSQFESALPNTYVWAGDGVIRYSPHLKQGSHYGGHSSRHYWFTFPMQDSVSPESFADNAEAMGSSLLSSGAYVNALVDQIKVRFSIPTEKVVLCGFQHGSCVALSASMMRIKDPYAYSILIEPYILESYYLQDEPAIPKTTVVCIDNMHIQDRIMHWMGINTGLAFQEYGMNMESITVDDGDDDLDLSMMKEAIRIMARL